MESTPGPWYSIIAPVPPLTVRISATLRITSLGEVQPLNSPVSLTPMTYKQRNNIHGIQDGNNYNTETGRKSLYNPKIT